MSCIYYTTIGKQVNNYFAVCRKKTTKSLLAKAKNTTFHKYVDTLKGGCHGRRTKRNSKKRIARKLKETFARRKEEINEAIEFTIAIVLCIAILIGLGWGVYELRVYCETTRSCSR
jgi:hypothetical protein